MLIRDHVWQSGIERAIIRRLMDNLVIIRFIGMLNILKNMLSSLVDKSNNIFQRLSKRKYTSEKELKYFTYSNKNATDLGKLNFFYLTFTSVYLMCLGD